MIVLYDAMGLGLMRVTEHAVRAEIQSAHSSRLRVESSG